ncbi:MAG: AAA family ATPase [Bacteroidota bacterium]
MYVPAERSFISAIKNLYQVKLGNKSLVTFHEEFENAKKKISPKGLRFPINDVSVEHDRLNDIVNLKGEDYKIRLTEASSGFLSSVPLFLVSWYLSEAVEKNDESLVGSFETQRFKKDVKEIWENESLTNDQRRAALSVLSSRFKKTAFINIVEEPELNLFPSSQRSLLNSLLKLNNAKRGTNDNKLIMTTHSPYIINYLSIAIQGFQLHTKLNKQAKLSSSETFKNHFIKFEEIVPEKSAISPNEVAVYQLDEKTGSISLLEDYEGIPSDSNYLNQGLNDANKLFDELLDIEETI